MYTQYIFFPTYDCESNSSLMLKAEQINTGHGIFMINQIHLLGSGRLVMDTGVVWLMTLRRSPGTQLRAPPCPDIASIAWVHHLAI